MQEYTLVISNPPHGQVDLPKAAPVLGLAPVELRMKTLYRVPEIWLADPDRNRIEEAARTLQDAGLNAAIAPGEEFLTLPVQAKVLSFSFADEHLVAAVGSARVELPYDVQVIAVLHTPREGGGTRTSEVLGARTSAAMAVPGAAGQPKDSAFFDMYTSREGKLVRLSVVQDVADFSGLGAQKLPSAAGNMRKFVSEWEGRFPQATVDRRLVNLQLRKTIALAKPSAAPEQRKWFSFASKGFTELIDTIAPELKRITQADFSSWLIYLTMRRSE